MLSKLDINKSLIIPCKNEGSEIIPIIQKFIENTKEDTQIYIVLDNKQDITFEILERSNLKIKICFTQYLISNHNCTIHFIFPFVLFLKKYSKNST